MLQPKSYPKMMGQALMFEAEPFITMTDDDNPWAEGLFLVVLMGVLAGAARVVGSVLMTASMPDPNALLAVVQQVLSRLGPLVAAAGFDPATAAEFLGGRWSLGARLMGYGVGWIQLFWLVLMPMLLALRWLAVGLAVHGAAHVLGGNGKFSRTLGAVALMAAPQIFLLLHVVPFVSVSGVLLWVWSMLIVYRAVQVSHDLPWRRAAVATLAASALLLILAAATGGLAGLILAVIGGAA